MKTKYSYPSVVELVLLAALAAVVCIAVFTALAGRDTSRNDLIPSLGDSVTVDETQRFATYQEDSTGNTCIIRITPRDDGKPAKTVGFPACLDKDGLTAK